MRVDLFDYELPADRIAQRPLQPRDSSKLLVLHRATGVIEHRQFRNIGDYLNPGDCLVVNDTKVVPARLLGVRLATGGKWEGLFLGVQNGVWELMTRTKGKPHPGEQVAVGSEGEPALLRLVEKTATGTWLARPVVDADPFAFLDSYGHTPIPCYIRGGHEDHGDRETYQTVYAANAGAAAAPTAGLHFTPILLEQLQTNGIDVERVTLHVGPGTFAPVKVDEIADHRMHAEWCELSDATATRLRQIRAAGNRIVAVGTTTVRTLESAWRAAGAAIAAFCGPTDIFIYPPQQCRSSDALVTNFHLPKSTLLMLVSTFASREMILDAYREAILQNYRFYSYGDAMLIV